MRASIPALILISVSSSGPLFAQDMGGQWIDRISSELRSEKAAPKEGSQFNYGAQAGIIYMYDTNIFLTPNNHTADSIWVPFVEANLAYAEPQFEATADFEGDYKAYDKLRHSNDWEQRFLGKVGYAGSDFGGSLIQMVRHESDPIDAVFADRVKRLVTDTIPRMYVDLTNIVAIEAEGHIEVVRFEDDTIGDSRNNENYRLSLAAVYKSEYNLDFLIQGGTTLIHYDGATDALGNPTAPPNVHAWFARAGLRGDLLPDFYIEALLGVTSIQSGNYHFATLPSHQGNSLTTMDASFFGKYRAMDRVVLSAGYSRAPGFAGGIDSYEIVNRFTFLAEIQATEQLMVRLRGQYDYVTGSNSFNRSYASASALASYKIVEHVVLDGGLTGRFGRISGRVLNSFTYDELLFQIGLGIVW